MTMQPATPQDVARAWGDAYAARDLEAMMGLFEDDAVWVSAEGDVVAGTEAIRDVFADFLAIDATYHADPPRVSRSGDLALLSGRWRLHGRDAGGEPVDITGRTADVLRRTDGGWRYVIDSPFGGG